MDNENPDGIDEILLSLQANEEDLLPTLTLYTGERLPSDPKPPLNLHLSLGGSYNQNFSNEDHLQEPCFDYVMKRSYLEQNQMTQKDPQEEIILIDNVAAITGGGGNIISNTAPDIAWAAQSASKNPALLRALQIIKSESSQQQRPPTTANYGADPNQGVGSQPNNDQCGTYGMSHANQGVPWQPEIHVLERGNSIMNPDDFLSLSPSNYKETSSGINNEDSMMIPPENLPAAVPAVPIIFPTASAIRDKGKSVMVVEPSQSATIMCAPPDPNYSITNYYGTGTSTGTAGGDGNLIITKSGAAAISGSTPPYYNYNIMPDQGFSHSNYPAAALMVPMANPFMVTTSSPAILSNNLVHNYDHIIPYMANAYNYSQSQAAAATNFAFASNPINNPSWSIPGNSSVVMINNIPAGAGGRSLLMKRNNNHNEEYVADSQIEVIRQMPTVATDGGIPDGRRIEGFLYQYNKYEEVIIVCFCHGCFFTPTQFVMHAGAPHHVDNPMRLITIVPP